MPLNQTYFEEIALKEYDVLFKLSYKLTHHRAAAEDLVQETYLRAFKFQMGFEMKEYGIKPWLLRILKNVHATNYRRQQTQPKCAAGVELDGIISSKTWDESDTVIAFENEVDDKMSMAIESLPEELRKVIYFRAFHGYSYSKIAGLLKIPVGTVMSRLHRCRKRLSKAWDEPTLNRFWVAA